MIPNPNSIVKDFFNPKQLVTRATMKEKEGKCAGCGGPTRQFDNQYGWYICIHCNADEVIDNFVRDITSF